MASMHVPKAGYKKRNDMSPKGLKKKCRKKACMPEPEAG
jgi:hypothetical protein